MLKKIGAPFAIILLCFFTFGCDDKGASIANNGGSDTSITDPDASIRDPDASDSDTTTPPTRKASSYKQLCAGGGVSSNGAYQMKSCIGPVDIAGPQLKNENYKLDSSAIQRLP